MQNMFKKRFGIIGLSDKLFDRLRSPPFKNKNPLNEPIKKSAKQEKTRKQTFGEKLL